MTKHALNLSLTLSRSEWVSVKIYNLLGLEIAALVNKNLTWGEHTMTWETRNISTGYYTIRMQTGSNSYAKRILISR